MSYLFLNQYPRKSLIFFFLFPFCVWFHGDLGRKKQWLWDKTEQLCQRIWRNSSRFQFVAFNGVMVSFGLSLLLSLGKFHNHIYSLNTRSYRFWKYNLWVHFKISFFSSSFKLHLWSSSTQENYYKIRFLLIPLIFFRCCLIDFKS